MQPDTIFRIYSLTKPITSVAVMLLVEEGLFWLEEPVENFIPAFRDVQVFVEKTPQGLRVEPPKRPPTLFDLLTHTGGIGLDALFGSPLASLYRNAQLTQPDQTLEEMVQRLVKLPLLNHPGEAWRYSISTDVLARIVEIASGKPFDEFLRQRLFEPLGMADTDFYVPPEKANRLATVYNNEKEGELRPVDRAESSPYITKRRYLSGSAGLVSTPQDYWRLGQMLLNKGRWAGEQLLRPETVEYMTQNQLPPELLPYALPWRHVKHYTKGSGFGLGFRVIMDVEATGLPGSVGEYAWAGATNTFFWADPQESLVLLLFMQSVPFMYYPIDREFKKLVYEALDA